MIKRDEEPLAWLLNLIGDFPQKELQSSNLRPMKQEQLGQLKQQDEILNAQIYTFNIDKGEFMLQKFVLMPNILLLVPDEPQKSNTSLLMPPQAQFQQQLNIAKYLILSNCTITQKVLTYKQSQAFGMILTNTVGNTYLFFPQFVVHRNWYKQLKQFCKLTDFLDKYKLGDKILPGFYSCVKKKVDDFEQCLELEEAVHNEIHILRSIKHQSLLELKRVYENPKYLFIVYEFYRGESLFKLLNSGVTLHEVQIASIVYQILQLIKFLNQHSFYHGSINPQNILINTQNQMLQITVINLSFKEYKVNDKLDWILNRAVEAFLAPEIYEGIAPNIQTDLYAIGCLLYFLSFYNPKEYDVIKNFFQTYFKLTNDDKDFYNIMDQFQIDTQKIYEGERMLQKRFAQDTPAKATMSSSQLDLLKKLLEQDPGRRMQLREATKHHWFVNVKNKIKSMKVERRRKKPLPSLRTIIELREQSEMDIRMSSFQQGSAMNPLGSRLTLTPQLTAKRGTFKHPTALQIREDDDDEVPDDKGIIHQIPIFEFELWDRPSSKRTYSNKQQQQMK